MKFIQPFVILAALVAICVAGCGQAAPGEMAVSKPTESAMAGAPMADAKAASSQSADKNVHPAALIPVRQIVRNGDLRVRVPNTEKAEIEVIRIIAGIGGYIESSEAGNVADASPSSTMHMRVPVSTFELTLEHFEKLGVRLSKNTTSEDVTEQVVDMDARLKTMAAEEETYRAILKQTRKLSDTIEVQDKLGAIRGQIESIYAQRKSLSSQASYSRINLTLEQDAVLNPSGSDPNWLNQSWAQATTSFGAVARAGLTAVIWLVVFSPMIAIAYLILRKAIRSVATPVYHSDGVSAKIP